MLTKTQSRIKPPVWATIDPAHSLARGLAGCWLLNEGAGRVARDVAGCRRQGSLSGAPAWSAGSFGSAVEFDGADDWISMGNCLNLADDDISVLAIVRYSAAGQPDSWNETRIGAVIGKGYLDGSGKGYGLLVETDNRLSWQIRNQANAFTATSDAALNDGRWHLAVGVCDRNDPTGVRLYIDGVRQSATDDATSLNGIDLVGPGAFAIGSRQGESSAEWYWDFAGSVAMACVWKRVLSEAEIRRLQQNPFEMLAPRRAVARLRPSGNLLSCAGSIGASAWLGGDLHVPRRVSLSGTARGSSSLDGTLSVTTAPPASRDMPRTRPTWQREALFHGRTHAALELGTVLTRGWFWVRRNGCAAVYRGSGIRDVDWNRILCTAGPNAREISLPRDLSHAAGSTECYVVRRFDGCGRQEKTVGAAAALRIASDGQSVLLWPNAVVGLTGRPIDATAVRLAWFYCPLDQEIAPSQFNLYRADAAGTVDLQAPIGTVRYQGRRCYGFDVTGPTQEQHAFVVRAASAAGVEGRSSVGPVHPIATATPEQAVILIAEPV